MYALDTHIHFYLAFDISPRKVKSDLDTKACIIIDKIPATIHMGFVGGADYDVNPYLDTIWYYIPLNTTDPHDVQQHVMKSQYKRQITDLTNFHTFCEHHKQLCCDVGKIRIVDNVGSSDTPIYRTQDKIAQISVYTYVYMRACPHRLTDLTMTIIRQVSVLPQSYPTICMFDAEYFESALVQLFKMLSRDLTIRALRYKYDKIKPHMYNIATHLPTDIQLQVEQVSNLHTQYAISSEYTQLMYVHESDTDSDTSPDKHAHDSDTSRDKHDSDTSLEKHAHDSDTDSATDSDTDSATDSETDSDTDSETDSDTSRDKRAHDSETDSDPSCENKYAQMILRWKR